MTEPRIGRHIRCTFDNSNDCYAGATGVIVAHIDGSIYYTVRMDAFRQDHTTHYCEMIHNLEAGETWELEVTEFEIYAPTPTSHETW